MSSKKGITAAYDNPKRLWLTVDKLLHRNSFSPLPTTSPGTLLADSFTSFFTGKISKLRFSPATLLHHLAALTLSACHFPGFLSFHSCFGIRNRQDPVQLSKQAIWFRSHRHLASQRMFMRTCSNNHHHCQPFSFSHFRPVSSHSQGICQLSTA